MNDTTTVKFMQKEDNSFFSFIRDGIYFSNIYMPQVGRGDNELDKALEKLTQNMTVNRSTNEVFMMGDWNLSTKHSLKRQKTLRY